MFTDRVVFDKVEKDLKKLPDFIIDKLWPGQGPWNSKD
jgi:hypothetical protein